MNILPIPQKMIVSSGYYTLKDTFTVSGVFNTYVETYFKGFLKFTKIDQGADIRFEADKKLSEEQYELEISAEHIIIRHSTDSGAFRALSTLKQIILSAENRTVPCVSIHDKPDIDNRGIMIDVSRGKRPTLATLFGIVDMMADLKYNQLQLYFGSLIFEYRSFKHLLTEDAYYTCVEIKALDKYCRERFIELVPNQNGFGHMGAWLSHAELAHLGITRDDGKQSNTLNPLNPESFELMQKIYGDVVSCFSSEYIHIGMDEPFELGMGETKEACKQRGIGGVFSDYIIEMINMVSEKYHKKVMFWADYPMKYPGYLNGISKDAIAVEWGYDMEHPYDRRLQSLKDSGMKFYVSPGTSTWGSISGRTNNMMFNIYKAAESAKYYGASGFLLTDWGDGGHPQFLPASYLPFVYGAAYAWNAGTLDHEKAFDERIMNIKLAENYIDHFIVQCEKKISFGNMLYKLGNYYLAENRPETLFNCTNLWKDCMGNQYTEDYKKVYRYIHDLEKELDQCKLHCKDGELVMREMKLSCKIIKYMTKVDSPSDDEKIQLIKEFQDVWEKRNYKDGSKIFLESILQ